MVSAVTSDTVTCMLLKVFPEAVSSQCGHFTGYTKLAIKFYHHKHCLGASAMSVMCGAHRVRAEDRRQGTSIEGNSSSRRKVAPINSNYGSRAMTSAAK